MALKEEVGRRVRQHREAAGLSQIALGERIGRSVQSIREVESGRSAPAFETLEALSAALGVPVAGFFPDEPPPAADEATARIARLLSTASVADRERAYRILVAALS